MAADVSPDASAVAVSAAVEHLVYEVERTDSLLANVMQTHVSPHHDPPETHEIVLALKLDETDMKPDLTTHDKYDSSAQRWSSDWCGDESDVPGSGTRFQHKQAPSLLLQVPSSRT